MKKKVLVIILFLLMILGIAIIISRYRGEKELIIAKNDEIILNDEAEEQKNEIENSNNIITENEKTEEIEEVTNDNVVSNETEDKVSVDIDKQQGLDNKNVEVVEIEDSKETMTTTKRKTSEENAIVSDTSNNEETTTSLSITTQKPKTKQTSNSSNINKETTKQESQSNVEQITPAIENTVKQTSIKCNHDADVGNSGEWFATQDEAKNSYEIEIEKWDQLLKKGKITYEEYCAGCPYRCEAWDCTYCKQWTINMYYR